VGVTLDAVLGAFGIGRDDSAAPNPDSGCPLVDVFQTEAGAVVVAERFDGYQGTRPEVLRRASVDGRAASYGWTIDADSRLSLAENGRVIYSSDILGEEPGPVPPEVSSCLVGLTFAENWLDDALMAISRFTLVSLPPSAELGHVGTFAVQPIADARPAEVAGDQSLGTPLDLEELNDYCTWWTLGVEVLDDEEVLGLVGAAASAPNRCRALAAFAIREGSAARGVQHDIRIVDVLTDLDAGRPPTVPPGLDAYIQKTINSPYGSPIPPDLAPLQALRAACHPNPVRGALDATFLTLRLLTKCGHSTDVYYASALKLLRYPSDAT
jgi:hypothetical protein